MTSLRENFIVRRILRRHLESEYAKRCLYEAMLFEAEGDQPIEQGAGSDFDAAEHAAKKVYDDAERALEAWDENIAKKSAFDSELKRLKAGGMGDERARKALRDNPKFAYNVPLAAKKRETLEADKEKALKRYAAYNPEMRGYQRDVKGGAKTTADKVMPERGKKRLLDISKIKFMMWHPWPKQMLSKANKLSYGSKAAGEETEQASSGTGPGEEWLASVFGGQVQGGGVSFDVVMPDGSAWEVKQLLSASETIRPGTEGLKAFEASRQRLNNIMRQLMNFVRAAKKQQLEKLLSPEDAKILTFVESFVTDEAEMIVGKGEISKERFIDLRSVLIAINKLVQKLNPEGDAEGPSRTVVSLNDKDVNVDKPTFIDVAKKVEKATNRDDILSDFEEIDIVLSTLKDAAFENPRAFLNEWFQSVKLDKVFSQVDGVFIVNPKGFMIIPRSELNKAMKFEKVTQGKPRFVLTIYGSGPSSGG